MLLYKVITHCYLQNWKRGDHTKMADFVRIAIGRLLTSGYALYVPLQRPLFDEIIILEGGLFHRCIIKCAVLCKDRGPTLSTKFVLEHHKLILSDLSIDRIIAVLPCRQQVWIIPMVSIGEITTIRLKARTDWLIGEVRSEQLDPSTRKQRISERLLIKEVNEERAFYDNILNH